MLNFMSGTAVPAPRAIDGGVALPQTAFLERILSSTLAVHRRVLDRMLKAVSVQEDQSPGPLQSRIIRLVMETIQTRI
jgi:hypothetical protein